MRRTLAALVALAGFLHTGGASAGSFFLQTPYDPVPAPPPLAPGTPVQQGTTELRVPGTIESRELVDVGIGADGVPVRVTATQRLRIDGTGDYSFVVPAPATSVVPGPGSESLPGLRNIGIIWQGFSDRHRVLSATATLRPASAATGLPLRVEVERHGGSTIVRLVNLARRRAPVVIGRTTPAALIKVLDELRTSYRRSRVFAGPLYVPGTAAERTTKIEVAAPLRVTGVISQGRSRVRVDGVLGDGQPLEREFSVTGATAPTLSLRVDLLPALEILPTPRELARAAQPIVTLQTAFGAVATASAYRRYLDAPSLAARTQASYVYRSVATAATVPVRVLRSGSDTLAIVLALLLGAAGLAGLAVLWARN